MRLLSVVSSFVFVACTLLGCSSSDDDPVQTATVTGAASSAKLSSFSAVARYGDLFPTTGGPSRGLRILISDKTNTCSVVHFAGATSLDVRIRGESSSLGTYPIVDARHQTPAAAQAEVDLNALDSACKDVVARTATGGTVTIKSVVINVTDPVKSRISGSVDVTFEDGHFAGDFDTLLCEDSATGAPPAACTR